MQGPIGQARRDKTHHPFYIVAAAAIDFALNSVMRQLINLARPARLTLVALPARISQERCNSFAPRDR